MKKISLALCITLLISCMGGGTVSAASYDTLYSNNFESEGLTLFTDDNQSKEYGRIEQTEIYGMENVFYSPAKATVNTYPFSENVYLLDDATGYDKAKTDLYVATEFDMIPIQGEPGVAMFSYNTRTDGTTAMDLKFLSTGSIAVTSKAEKRSSTAARQVSICSFSYGKPYRIRMVFHVSDSQGNSCEELTDVLVNGKSVIGDEKHFMKSHSFGKVDYYNALRLFNAGNMRIANVNVYQYTAGNEPPDKGRLVSLIRGAETYAAGAVNQDVIAAAKAEYVSLTSTQKSIDVAANALNAAMRPFTLKGIITQSKSGKTGDFLYENGLLRTVVLNKNVEIATDSTLYVAFYSQDGNLQKVTTAKVLSTEPKGEVEIRVDVPLDVNLIDWSVSFFVMDGNLIPLMTKKKLISTEKDVRFENVKVYDGTTMVKVDTLPMIYNNGKAYVPANNILNFLGMKLERNGSTYTAVRAGEDTLSFTVGSNIYHVNKKITMSDKRVELIDGYVPIIDAEMIEKAFTGVEITPSYDGVNAKLEITNSFVHSYQSLSESGITALFNKSHSPRDLKLILSGMNESDKPKVYLKISDNQKNAIDMSSFYNAEDETKWNGYYKQSLDNGLYYYPKEVKGLRYENGQWIGYLGDMVTGGRNYDLIVEKGGISYIEEEAVTLLSGTGNFYPTTRNESLYDTEGDLKLVPTYENIGYYFDSEVNAENVIVTYKETFAEEYQTAITPYYDHIGKQFRGSITGLKDNTEYIVKIDLGNGITKEKKVKTWANQQSVEKTVKLSEIYSGGPLTISGYHGAEDRWIRIDGEGMTVDGTNSSEAVFIADSSYVLVENLKVIGGDRTGILVASSAENVRISNCDISGWGRRGVYDKNYMEHVADGGLVNYEAGIRMLDARNITVEKCYIHDSLARTNPWKPDETRAAIHPKGSCGIYYQVKDGCVIRYNDIIGNDEHRFNDGIEGMDNTANYGGAARDTDIYGNMIYGCEDDGVELDGGQMNVRFYNNRIEQTLCGVSTAPQGFGPTYIYRNVITNTGTTLDNYAVGTGIKSGGTTTRNQTEIDKTDMGIIYVFNNTIDGEIDPIKNVGIVVNGTPNVEYHAKVINNILISRKESGVALENRYADSSKDSISHNLTYGEVSLNGLSNVNGRIGQPAYKEGTRCLTFESAGLDSGTVIPGITESYQGIAPDIGAVEYGTNELMPYRSINVAVDKYILDLSSGGKMVTVTLTEEASLNYSIEKSEDLNWLTVSENGGTLNMGAFKTLTFTANKAKIRKREGNGLVLIRFENGYSIPISVFCSK